MFTPGTCQCNTAPVQFRVPAMASGPTILVVDDEPDIRELVRFHLAQEGYAVCEADTGERALALASTARPALIMLDLMLPGTDGLEVCQRRGKDETLAGVPITMLTARATECDRVLCLELGADDYIAKPFSPRELVARVRAILRRSAVSLEPAPHEVYSCGRLSMDFDTYEVTIGGQPTRLSLRAFELLKFFVRHPRRAYGRMQLLDLVWGRDTHVQPRTIDVHIGRLRKLTERDNSAPRVILTVRGVGYAFVPEALE